MGFYSSFHLRVTLRTLTFSIVLLAFFVLVPEHASTQPYSQTPQQEPVPITPAPAPADTTAADTTGLPPPEIEPEIQEPSPLAPQPEPVPSPLPKYKEVDRGPGPVEMEEVTPVHDVVIEEPKVNDTAHAIGFGFSHVSFMKTIKHGGDSLNTTEEMSGYQGIYFHYRMIKPTRKIYFSPNIIYSYQQKEITSGGETLDSYYRYVMVAGNIGLNVNELIERPLIIETFLEGGLGAIAMEEGLKQSDSNWHFLLIGMDLLCGGRYWISRDFGVEATFRYINCFVDSGLDSEDTEEFITFNDYKIGIGIVVKP